MNTFGTIFKISVFGESHGKSLGIVIDNCPPGIKISENDFTEDIKRRKGGTKGTTPRVEEDIPEFLSGIYNGYTTGSPISIIFNNNNIKSSDYTSLKNTPRPGHVDFTAEKKYNGYADPRGSGHFSGRLTLPIVAAGVIAKKICGKIKFQAALIEAGGSGDIQKAINHAIENQDSIGGIIECKINKLPVGLGEPYFNSVESLISQLVFSIPAIKAIEFGSGFKSATMFGSEHNDAFISTDGKTLTNHSGGINGGLTNGNELIFRVAVKPASSISKTQETLNMATGKTEKINISGRHDVCIALRVPVIIEAVAAIVLADLIMIDNAPFKNLK
ncbi:MAG: chorismate synthase [Bacteroidota bacterium]